MGIRKVLICLIALYFIFRKQGKTMGKRKLYLLKYYSYISVLILSLLQGCSNNKEEEIERITSPDSLVDAVLTGSSGGATTSYSYRLYLVPSGKEPKKNQEVFMANHTTGLSIHWINPTHLEIAFDESRIYHFTNFWSSYEFDNPFYIINIRLKWKIEREIGDNGENGVSP